MKRALRVRFSDWARPNGRTEWVLHSPRGTRILCMKSALGVCVLCAKHLLSPNSAFPFAYIRIYPAYSAFSLVFEFGPDLRLSLKIRGRLWRRVTTSPPSSKLSDCQPTFCVNIFIAPLIRLFPCVMKNGDGYSANAVCGNP